MAEYDLGQAGLIQMMVAAYRLFDVGAIGLLRMTADAVAKNPLGIEVVEGATTEVQEGVFALAECPFAKTLATFKASCGELPEELSFLVDHANEQGEAWVSAFCGIHQAFRQARLGDSYQQIGCRSGDKVSIAVQEFLSDDEARSLLETSVCLYAK